MTVHVKPLSFLGYNWALKIQFPSQTIGLRCKPNVAKYLFCCSYSSSSIWDYFIDGPGTAEEQIDHVGQPSTYAGQE
jgi:hypothetical protein